MSEGALPSASPILKKTAKICRFFCFIKTFALSLYHKPKAIVI